MRNLMFFALMISVNFSFAQQSDTLYSYTNIGGKTVKKDKAVNIYKIYKRDSLSWVKTTSNTDLVVLKQETYADSLLSILNGPYYEYYNTGKTKLKGYYTKGNKTRIWIAYAENGNAQESVTFSGDKKNGLYTLYHANGNIKMQGNYINNVEDGEWISYKENGEIEKKQIMAVPSNPVQAIASISPPEFTGGMEWFKKHLQRSIIYPQEEKKKRDCRRSILQFCSGYRWNC